VPSIFLKIVILSTITLMSTARIVAAAPNDLADITIDDPSKAILLAPVDIKWIPAPAALPAGAELCVLEGYPEKPGPFTLRLKLPPHYTLPAHWHPNDEHITVISGQLNLGLGDRLDTTQGKLYSTGSYTRIPAKMHYFTWTSEEETILQLHGIGPWAVLYVETPGEPPQK